MIITICKYFFWFILYSVGGWILETLLFLIRDKKVVKRGFLFGPLCPIYGTGAVICTAIMYGRINNIFLVFLIGLLLCGTLEYLTHFIMEKLFHAMWWDYSSRRFNINGRVYLNGLLEFGAGSVLIIKVLQPLVVKLTDMIPENVLYIICFALYSIILVDVSATLSDLKVMLNTLKKLQNLIITETQKGFDATNVQIENINATIKESEIFKSISSSFISENRLYARVKKIAPDFKLEKYKKVLDIIRDQPQEDKARKDIKLYGTADSIPTPDENEK